MNVTQRQNLARVATGIRYAAPRSGFDMSRYLATKYVGCEGYDNRDSLRPSDASPDVYNECGTTACFAGHGPMFGLPVIDADYDCWGRYCHRIFGLSPSHRAWDWLFSPTWADIDNTPQGAAARAFYYLDRGLPPLFLDHGLPSLFSGDYDDDDDAIREFRSDRAPYDALIAAYL